MLTPGSGELPDFTAPLISPPFEGLDACATTAGTVGDVGAAVGADCGDALCAASGTALNSSAQQAKLTRTESNRTLLLRMLILLRGIRLGRGLIGRAWPYHAHLWKLADVQHLRHKGPVFHFTAAKHLIANFDVRQGDALALLAE